MDTLRIEHAAAIARVREQEEVVAALQKRFNEVNEEYRNKKQQGMTIADAVGYDLMLRVQEKEIDQARETLALRKKEEESKRNEVIHAKTDKATIERLKRRSGSFIRNPCKRAKNNLLMNLYPTPV